ncbi:MAG: hypothetical protein R3F56_00990 [Planctomycetota bacterium]
MLAFAWLSACSSGDDGPAGRDGIDRTGLKPGDDLPGVVVVIEAVSGGTGFAGAVQVGDRLTVDFTLHQKDATPIDLTQLARAAIMVSGPTFNYQRVIESQSDLVARSSMRGPGAYRYRFQVPIPATYLPPLNDTAALTDGELTGQALLAGTYTVGIEARRDFDVAGAVVRDVGNASRDFLFGSASTLEPREVVTQANCNQCHTRLAAHGGNRTDVRNCLLCHTAGAEDRNVAAVAGGTPGATVEFKVMIHKIHAGANLPSVTGMTSDSDGFRDYSVASVPYRLIGFGDNLVDYSHVRFPVWPSLAAPMPRDLDYVANTPEAAKEDLVRSGPVDCATCHGDPDGTGPLQAPAQGDLAYRQPTRRACAACHDDWLPSQPYIANGQTMPPQLDDSQCIVCHGVSGDGLAVMDAHLHPLRDPAVAAGVNFTLTGPSANLHAGDKPMVTFSLADDSGSSLAAADLARIEVGVNGPTANPNLLLSATLPAAALSGPGPYTTALPERVYLERVGVSAAGLQAFSSARQPHWNVSGAATEVYLRPSSGPPGASSQLAAAAALSQNFVDVLPGDGSLFARNDYVVLEDGVGGQEEYLRIQWVDGDRLWFSSPRSPAYPSAVRKAHPAGAAVAAVTLNLVPSSSYGVVGSSGTINETVEFGDGVVLTTYTTDFVLPTVFPGALNDSPDLGEKAGDWGGLPLVDGTYTIGIWGTRTHSVDVMGIVTPYTEASKPATATFLFGAATTKVENQRIGSPEACYACHVDLQFHGGNRRGYETCLLCHGNAGSEDRARHVAANAPATTGVSVDFREMIHKIHHGRELSMAYEVVGFGSSAYPDNFSVATYGEVGFPAMPEGTKACVVCHGASDAWRQPADRVHPQGSAVGSAWTAACIACHDTRAAIGHAGSNTAHDGAEACAECHGIGREQDVALKHKVR